MLRGFFSFFWGRGRWRDLSGFVGYGEGVFRKEEIENREVRWSKI